MNIHFENEKLGDAFAEAVMKIAEDQATDIKTANRLFAAVQDFQNAKLRQIKAYAAEAGVAT